MKSTSFSKQFTSHTTHDEPEPDDEEGLELGVYLSWVKNEVDNEIACLELPFTIILLISFSCLAYLHLQQDKVFGVEGALRFDVEENANFAWSHNFGHKTINDVNSIPDYWSWFRIGFLPLVVQHSWSYSESLSEGYMAVNASHPYDAGKLPERWMLGAYGRDSQPLPVRDDYLRYHRLVGGLRLRQERSRAGYELCRFPGNVPEELWRRWLRKPCLPAQPAYELTPEPSDAEAFHNPQRVEWLLPGHDLLQDLQRAAVDMEDGCAQLPAKGRACLCSACSEDGGAPRPWLDERVQRVEIGYILYNSEYGLFSLVTVNFFFSRSGMIRKLVHVQSSWANDFDRPFFELALMVTCDLVWILSLSWVLVSEVSEVKKNVRSSKQRWYRSLWDYVGLWNTVDWISIVCALVLVAMYVRLQFATAAVNAEFVRIAGPGVPGAERSAHIATSEKFFGLVEDMCSEERIYRLVFIVYPMAVMARLFKSFDAQPRLAVVTRTLVYASSDMTHFFIVFFSVYFCMVVNSVLLFGQKVEDFATPVRALISCFQVMFGSWDYGQLRKVGLSISAVWMWIFVLVISVLLLNMLLAILMDAYTEVKSNATDARTLFKQTSEALRRRREFQRGKRVRLTDIWAAFFEEIGDEKEMLESKERMTPEKLMERVKGLRVQQAERTLRQAKNKLEDSLAVPYTNDSIKCSVDILESRTRLIREEVKKVRKTMEAYCDAAPVHPSLAGTANHDRQLQLVEAVRSVIGELSDQLSETLSTEGQIFEQRRNELGAQQDELLVCAQDARCALQQMRARSDEASRGLRRQLLAEQQRQLRERRPPAVGGRGGGLAGLAACAACAEPQRAAPVQLLG
mmetsp:Transcript_36482/g.101267  ORF Transcript_36482/g.101267 Transcript_36482/m.101267 type:complete len:854 (-) Transcript_36482:274-2835(-)